MKKLILLIISTIIILIVAFIFGIQLSKTVKESEKNEIEDVQDNTTSKNEEETNIYQDDTTGTNKIYYLHKSDIEIPTKNNCSIAKASFFKGISESDKKDLQIEIRIYS